MPPLRRLDAAGWWTGGVEGFVGAHSLLPVSSLGIGSVCLLMAMCAVGRHLGTANGHHPIDRGFETYVGLPYSNDMGCSSVQAVTYWDVNHSKPGLCPSCASGPKPVGGKDYSCGRTKEGGGCIDSLGLPIFYNKTIMAQPVNLTTISTQYAHAGARFVAQSAASSAPFFLNVANSHVHVPQNHAARFTGKSGIGPFGDALMEMDWEIGEIVDAVEAAGVSDNTLFLVSGDNGPWECKCNLTGSSGPYTGLWQKTHGGGGSSRKTTLWVSEPTLSCFLV